VRKSSNKGGRKSAKSSQPKAGAAVAEPSKDGAAKTAAKSKTFGAKTATAAQPAGSMASRILRKVKDTATGVAARVTGQGAKKSTSKTKT